MSIGRYKVLVHTKGKKDYEDVGTFTTLDKAKEWVERAKQNRDEKIAQGKTHFEGLDWAIIDLGK